MWGLYTHVGVGIDIKRISVMAGYKGYLAEYMNLNYDGGMKQANSLYLQLGIRW